MPWVDGLKKKIEVLESDRTPMLDSRAEERQKNLNFLEAFRALGVTPPLRRMNGVGFGLYGWLNDARFSGKHLKLYFFTVLWIPIIPICGYLVERNGNGFNFYRYISLWGILKNFKWRTFSFFLTAVIEGFGLLLLFGGMISLVYWIVHLIFRR